MSDVQITDEKIRFMARYGKTHSERSGEMEVEGRKVIIPGFEEFTLVVHGWITQRLTISDEFFSVSEATTGMGICSMPGWNSETAVERTADFLANNEITPDAMRQYVLHEQDTRRTTDAA